MFYKIGVLKNFAKFTGKHLHWIVFLIKNIILAFYRTPPVDCFHPYAEATTGGVT